MPSVQEALKIGSLLITPLEARFLLEFAVGEDVVLKDPLSSISKSDFKKFISFLKRRIRNEPIAYITGKKEFFGIEFFVSKSVLIPRPETEILVQKSIDILFSFPKGARIVDLCTGSGAIALTLASYVKKGDFTGIDVSSSALKIAKLNREKLCLNEVRFLKQDLFSKNFNIKGDVLVSNPPYIKPEDMPKLMPDVKDFEPHLALNGGKDGLAFYKRIAEISKNFQFVILEIGEKMEENVTKIFLQQGYNLDSFEKDFFGKIRVLCFKRG